MTLVEKEREREIKREREREREKERENRPTRCTNFIDSIELTESN